MSSTRRRSRPSRSAGYPRGGAAAQARRGGARPDTRGERPARRPAAGGRAATDLPAGRRRTPTTALSSPSSPRFEHRGGSCSTTTRSRGGSAGRPSCPRREPGRPCGPAHRAAIPRAGSAPTRRTSSRPRSTIATRASPSRRAPAPSRRPGGSGERPCPRASPLRRPHRALRGRRCRSRRARPDAPRRPRMGCAARAVARPRQGDGGRVSRRDPRQRSRRRGPGRHGHDHPHGRGVRPRSRDARPLAVRASRAALSLAHPAVRADGRRGRRRRSPVEIAEAPSPRTTITTITGRASAAAARHGRRRRASPLPVGAGRAARRHLAAPGGARDAPHSCLQPRPRRHTHRARRGRGPCAAVAAAAHRHKPGGVAHARRLGRVSSSPSDSPSPRRRSRR